jgi:hypothetical protein
MSLMGDSMHTEPYKSIFLLLAVSVLAIGTLASALLIADFIYRLEWRDYEFDRGGTCETIQCGNMKGARIDTNQWP